MASTRITIRTAERFCRQALDMEVVANRLEDAGYDYESAIVREIAHQSGNVGARLTYKLELRQGKAA